MRIGFPFWKHIPPGQSLLLTLSFSYIFLKNSFLVFIAYDLSSTHKAKVMIEITIYCKLVISAKSNKIASVVTKNKILKTGKSMFISIA